MSAPLVVISDWKPLCRNTLRGFLTAHLPSGMTLHELSVHYRGGAWWVTPPGKPMLGQDGTALRDGAGKIRYVTIIDFEPTAARQRFSTAIIDALRMAHPESVRGGDGAMTTFAPVADIQVGTRHRRELGDIDGLAPAWRIGGDGYPAELLCPCCGSEYLHHAGISVYERNEDAPRTLVTVHEARTIRTAYPPSAQSGNPSSRRDAIAIRFWCEGCCNDDREPALELTFAQHKGVTYIEWRSASGSRP